MGQDLLSIGTLARASGLSVSTLRFYDREGLIEPTEVSAHSGYRWYAREQIDDARLVAALRRIGLPLAEMSEVLADRERAAPTLTEHVRRLEEGLAVARAETSLIRERWTHDSDVAGPRASPGKEATVVVAAGDLDVGLRTVRHAVGDDPDMPAIHGVFLVALSNSLRLAATDRVRCAFAEVPAACTGKLRALLSTEHADHLAARLAVRPSDAQTVLTWRAPRLTVRCDGDLLLDVDLPEAQFPDLSHAIPTSRGAVDLAAEELSSALAAEPQATSWWLSADGHLTPDAGREPGAPGHRAPDHPARGTAARVDREYLVAALDALGQGGRGSQLRLDLDGPAHPLALRRAEDPRSFVVLLPII